MLRELEWSIVNAKDLSELGNALFRAGYELMNGNLSQGEYERLRELGRARRAALIKKLRMEEGLTWVMEPESMKQSRGITSRTKGRK